MAHYKLAEARKILASGHGVLLVGLDITRAQAEKLEAEGSGVHIGESYLNYERVESIKEEVLQ